MYVYGFDCAGFVRWICEKCGLQPLDGLSETLIQYYDHQAHYVFSSNSHLDMRMPPWAEVSASLRIGDFFIIKHGGCHVMMYIGTLADYGFTASEVPELADYLQYPLVIHCGPTPAYAPRYQKLFDENPEYYQNCTLTDGGVQVSVLGIPAEAVPYHTDFQKQHADYFLLGEDQQMMTVIDMASVTSWCWYRTNQIGDESFSIR